MPTLTDALRFVADERTSTDKLRRACEILGLPAEGDALQIRTRLLGHLDRLDPQAPVVCLNPALAPSGVEGPDPLGVVRQFNEAFNRHDVDALMTLMTDDCVFENTRPAPDGERFEGQAAVRACWERLFSNSPRARFEFGDMFAAGDRCVVLWTYHWMKDTGSGHVRGVDVFRVRNGKVAEKLSYVKG